MCGLCNSRLSDGLNSSMNNISYIRQSSLLDGSLAQCCSFMCWPTERAVYYLVIITFTKSTHSGMQPFQTQLKNNLSHENEA